MMARSIPEDGDIVVREEQREGKVVYVLHTAPGADQYVLGSREDAVRQAAAFAKRQSVRAWLTEGDYDFVLLEDFRVRLDERFHDGKGEGRRADRHGR
jgi:hypothetical protein